jgi:predicted DNA-binding protein (MmcQ/YjbR family)
MDLPTLPEPTAALKAVLDALPGATAEPQGAPRGAIALSLKYKVMGKMFAILSTRRDQFVILKCDPHLAETLRAQYAGVGHRSHLDARFRICVTLDADVPAKEVKRLVAHSYDLVRAGLTKKQQADLAALAG